MIILTDIHGCYKTMIALLEKIPQSEKDKGIVICGDLIDRGPMSRQVVQYCIDNKIPVVKGNHEDMMIGEAESIKAHLYHCDYIPNSQSLWTMNGGYEALKSYSGYDESNLDDRGVPKFIFETDIFNEHVKWMNSLPLFIEFPEVKKEDRHLVISHSSIASVWKYRNTEYRSFAENIMWGRPATINDVPEIYNVFGHTPCENGPKLKVPFANIDTGCFYKHPSYGKLTALQFPEMIVYEQENID